MTPTVPWLGLVLLTWLLYRAWERKHSAKQLPETFSPEVRRMFTLRSRATMVYAVAGIAGIVPMVFEYDRVFWVPPLIVAGIAFIVRFVATQRLFKSGVDPRRVT